MKKEDKLYIADKAVRNFCKSHPKDLNAKEHRELSKLLQKRASAISEILGVKVHSISGK